MVLKIVNIYHLPTKLRKGNVFSCVCLLRDSPWLWPLSSTQDPPCSDTYFPRLENCSNVNVFTWAPPLASDIWCPRPKTFSNLLIWGSTPPWCWHLVATVAWAMGQRAVRILLHCFLVLFHFEETTSVEVPLKFTPDIFTLLMFLKTHLAGECVWLTE